MIVDRSQLLADLKACLPSTDKGLNASIEGFDTLWFDGSYVHSFNRIVAMSVPCTVLGLGCAVKAKEIVALLSKYKAPTIDMEQGQNCLTWKCGRGSGSITTLDTSIRERIVGLALEDCTFSQIPEGMMDGIRLCYIPKNPSRLKSVCVSGNNVYSTDGIRMNIFRMPAELKDGVYLDEPAVKILCALPDPVEICVSGSWCHFRYDTGMIFSAIVKRFQEFPEVTFRKWVSLAVRKEGDVSGKIPESVIEVVERVAIFSDTTTGRCPITLKMGERDFTLSSRKDSGEISETVSWDIPFDEDPEITLVIDAPFLLQIANKAPKFYITTLSGIPGIVFHSEGFMQIVNLTPPKRVSC